MLKVLSRIVAARGEAWTIGEFIEATVNEMSRKGISQKKMKEVVNALGRGGALLNADGSEAFETDVRFCRSAATTPEGIETYRVRGSTAAILQADPNWFEDPTHRDEFATVVGASPPDADILAEVPRRVSGAPVG